MAEVVQSFMEGMLPELEEYVKFGIFTREEVRSIIKKRSQFEYLIKRRAPELNDYLRYAQYEMNLNLLRKRRRSKLCMHLFFVHGDHTCIDIYILMTYISQFSLWTG